MTLFGSSGSRCTSRVGPASGHHALHGRERRPTIVSFMIDHGGPALADPHAGAPDLVPPYNYLRSAPKSGRTTLFLWN
jgi:hypothetical protein